MSDLRESAKLALKVLENKCEPDHEAIAALRQALEQPAIPSPPEAKTEGEKLNYAFGWFKALEYVREKNVVNWIGLTDDERRELRKRNQKHDAFAIAVEALLKQKNGYNK